MQEPTARHTRTLLHSEEEVVATTAEVRAFHSHFELRDLPGVMDEMEAFEASRVVTPDGGGGRRAGRRAAEESEDSEDAEDAEEEVAATAAEVRPSSSPVPPVKLPGVRGERRECAPRIRVAIATPRPNLVRCPEHISEETRRDLIPQKTMVRSSSFCDIMHSKVTRKKTTTRNRFLRMSMKPKKTATNKLPKPMTIAPTFNTAAKALGLKTEKKPNEESEQNKNDARISNVANNTQEAAKTNHEKGGKRPAVSQSDHHLRATYHLELTRGEEYYNNRQYSRAMACFNDAKSALLRLLEQERDREKPSTVTYARLRDRINLALVSERVSDCHFVGMSLANDGTDGDAASSLVSYRQAVDVVSETKALLAADIKCKLELTRSPVQRGTDAEIRNLKNLHNEATLSLARISTKQGCVSAKANDHYPALNSFGDSIAAWEEMATITSSSQDPKISHMNQIEDSNSDDILIHKTREVILSFNLIQKFDRIPLYSAYLLKNTTDLKALSAALHMARSHHALGVEEAMAGVLKAAMPETSTIKEETLDQFKEAINHHLYALKLIGETQRLQSVPNTLSLDEKNSTVSSAGAANIDTLKEERLATIDQYRYRSMLTTCAHDLSVLTNQSDSKDIIDNVEQFLKRCTLLMVQQQVFISHACSRLGLWGLSSKWLSKSLDNINELGLLDVKEEAKAVLYMISVTESIGGHQKGSVSPCSVDLFSLYKDGDLEVFLKGYSDMPRLFVHLGLGALKKGLTISAIVMFQKITEIYDLPAPPGYYKELLHAINAQIVIRIERGDMDGAVQEMSRRLDIISKWVGSTSVELAHDHHRLACLHSALGGHHEKCVLHLEESLRIGGGACDYDALDSIKLLATSYDAMNDTFKATRQYERALSIEEDFNTKVTLMNALSHLHIKAGGQSHLAVDSSSRVPVRRLARAPTLARINEFGMEKAINCLEKSLQIQQDDTNTEREENALLSETMILYGNAMSSKKTFSQAIDWYESALSANPDKSAIHPTNLRALYNKGIAFLQNKDVTGAVHAFETILDEVDKISTTPPCGTGAVLNAIGRIYFEANNFAGAIERFTQSLSLKNECLSPCQRVGTLCNIASAYYAMQSYEEAEKILDEALTVSKSLDETSLVRRATIMCKLACVLFRRKYYLRAHDLFSDGKMLTRKLTIAPRGNRTHFLFLHYCILVSKAALIGGEDVDDEFNKKCEGYAIACYFELKNQQCKHTATTTANDPTLDGSDSDEASTSSQTSPKKEYRAGVKGDFKSSFIIKSLSHFIEAAMAPQKEEYWSEEDESEEDNDGDHPEELATEDAIPAKEQDVTAREPEFEGRLIPITDEHSATIYRDAVYPWNAKMLRALGVKPFDCDSIAVPSGDRKILCNRALTYLLEQTADCRAKYVLEVEGSFVRELNSKFMTMKPLLDNEVRTHNC